MNSSGPSILVASDNASDADLVKRLLVKDFPQVVISTVEERAVADFEQHVPDVLVLAFKAVEASELYYLGLYRQCAKVASHPHRTIILCDKDEVYRVSRLCLKQHFDDYVLFWPMNYDAPRLTMSIHLAQRELKRFSNDAPSPAEFATQARRLAELEALLDQHSANGIRHVHAAQRAVDVAQQEVGAALDGFSRDIGKRTNNGAVPARALEGMQSELARLRHEQIVPQLQAVRESVRPIERWTAELKQQVAAPLESIRAMAALAEQFKPLILVVDDDEFQHKIVAKILGAEQYQLAFACDGADALSFLRRTRADLILMDVQMPNLDGLETTRRLKAMPHLANVPIVMISGKSEGNVVVQCLKSGAADFVVKPFDRDTLLVKVARLSGLSPASRKPQV